MSHRYRFATNVNNEDISNKFLVLSGSEISHYFMKNVNNDGIKVLFNDFHLMLLQDLI